MADQATTTGSKRDNISDGFNTIPHSLQEGKGIKTRTALLLLAIIFVTALTSVLAVYKSFPDLESDEIEHVKLPRDLEDAKKLGLVLDRYKEKYYYQVVGGVFVTYVFLQSFAIPGSIFLSILSGFLFRFPVALFLVCLCSAVGASLCYLLSYLVGRGIVQKYFPERASQWSRQVRRHEDQMIWYIIFLRITPFLPNWFINITSPVIGVGLIPFFMGTFLGVAPPSFVAIQAGTTLHELSSSRDALSWTSILVLAAFAILSLLPVLFRSRLRSKME